VASRDGLEFEIMRGDPLVFALEGSHALGSSLGASLGVPLASHEERDFEDGEFKIRSLVTVRDRDVYVLHALAGSPSQSPADQLLRLLTLLGAVRDAGAARVTALVPYLAFARKDARTKPRDPLTLRYVAGFFEAVGVDLIAVLDVHNIAAFENAFRCRTEHLEARPLFVAWLRERLGGDPVVMVSPDAGGVKRAERLRQSLERALGRGVGMAFLEKYRSEGVVSGEALVGQVDGRAAVILDDLISTGTTLARAAHACVAAGATRVLAAASHGLFVGEANRILGEAPLEAVVVTDSVPAFRIVPGALQDKLVTLATGPLLADVVRRLHAGGSLSALRE
jgi:ribose-phosphate pyrophosphokinase